MSEKRGRPAKTENNTDTKQLLINAAVHIIKTKGAGSVTIRNVCEVSGLSIGTFYHHFRNKDDLLIYFIREESFDAFSLQTPIEQFPDRISELYMHLIRRYMDLGMDFMKSFYTTENQALSAYMGLVDGKYAEGTVMARCETEAANAVEAGILKKETDIHILSTDICTIVKGCVFEWSLGGGKMALEDAMSRIIRSYCNNYLS